MTQHNEIGIPKTIRPNRASLLTSPEVLAEVREDIKRLCQDDAELIVPDRPKLHALLRERGLVPLPLVYCLGADSTLRKYDEDGPLFVLGVTGNNARHEVGIRQLGAGYVEIIHDTFQPVDAAIFNRAHMLPMPLGWVDQDAPIRVSACCHGTPTVLPDLDLCFWGLRPEQYEQTRRSSVLEDARFWELVEDLRRDPPADPRMRALLDKLAPHA